MTIKMKVGEIDVSISDPVEAAALLRELQKGPRQPSNQNGANGPLKGLLSEAQDLVDADVAETTLKFLKAIDRSLGPMTTAEVMSVLGASNANAVGGNTKKINRLLAGLGFRKNLVYQNPKKPNQGRTWVSARHIKRAIGAVEESINSQK